MAVTADAVPDLSAYVGETGQGGGRIELLVKGARCAACLSKIERGVKALPGVDDARLNLTTGKLAVRVADRRKADPERVIRAVRELGYSAVLFDPKAALDQSDREGRELVLALGVAGFGVANAMMFTVPAWAGLFGQELGPGARTLMYWLSALVATPCALYAARPFFRSAWNSLRRGRANMDVPISIGVLLTLAVSFSETLQRGPHAYFDAAVTLLFLLLIGRWLDHRLRLKAQGAARDLLMIQAPVAARLDDQGREHMVPAARIAAGDRVAVKAGDRIPVDAVVLEGRCDLDNALVSGETAPVSAAAGDKVHAGALALNGRLVLRATARSEDSTVAAIARLMEIGAQSRSAYVRLADKAAAVYVPVVHTLALATFLGGWALGLGPREAILRAAAVLIVTCPCALGLAVPAVQITASGLLFRKGVLVKSGAALERLAEVDWVVLDKTGVVTEGRPRLIAGRDDLLSDAATLARASRHPLARALAEAAGPGPVAADAVETPGMGVEGLVRGVPARIGRAAFVGHGVVAGDGAELWFIRDGEAPVRFDFADALRPESAAVVRAFKARGLRVEMLSGDVEAETARAARAIGADSWRSGLTPQDKAAAVDDLKAAGRKVLMIGDGLNDAAALSKAHASMAPGSAVEVSQNAADLVLTTGGLAAAPEALDLARQARARALENFGLSAVYNLIAAPAAMLGLVNPFVAAIAMSGSSLVVMLNALRLARSPRPARRREEP
ncbi:MAG: heavy metal translocating P-type ATPase [Caulobacteraceae bacterium]